MARFFITIYRFFDRHTLLFYLFLVVIIALLAFFGSQIRFEENIMNTLDGKVPEERSAMVASNLRISEKLIVTLSLSDSTAPAQPDSLQQFGENMVEALHTAFDTTILKNISFRASEEEMVDILKIVTNHLPSFLTAEDYMGLDTLLTDEAIAEALEKDYRILLSPGSMVMKRRIIQDPLGITNPAFSKLQSLQAGDQYTIYNGSIFTRDLKHLILFLTPANPVNETAQNTLLVQGTEQIIDSTTQAWNHRVSVALYGPAAISVANANQLKRDIILTLLIGFTLIFLLLSWYFRSPRVPFLGLLPALFGGGLAMAILAATKGSISAISLGIGSVILGLIVDYALYIINHFRRRGNIEAVLEEMSQTIVVCSLTSAGAFLCLIFLNSSVLHDLGWFAALSVAGAALFALVILPQLLSERYDHAGSKHKESWVDRFCGIRFEKRPSLLVATGLILVIGALFAGKAGFEQNLSSLSFVTPRLKQAESSVNRITETRLKKMYLVSTGSSPEEALQHQERLMHWIDTMRSKGLIRQVTGAGPFLMSAALQQVRIDKWNSYWTSAKREQVTNTVTLHAARLGFKPGAFDPFLETINRKYSPLYSNDPSIAGNPLISDWMTVTGGFAYSTLVLNVEERDKEGIYDAFHFGDEYLLFDKQQLTDLFVASVKRDFDLLVTLSMIFVSLLLILSFGRIDLGIITALPMFLSWVITLGFMGISGLQFNIFNIIISSFIFGLGVDYSILMMRGLQQDYKYGTDNLASYKTSIFLSSATTLFGVGALWFARHPALHSIAPIALVGIISVVMLTYLLIPFLFNSLILDRAREGKYPVTLRIAIKTFITWGNILAIALLLMILGWIIRLLPIGKERRQLVFHWVFSKLSKGYISFTFAGDQTLLNSSGVDLSSPGIIISNHQSLIETPAYLRLHPKIIILTTTWVHRSPIFGPIARLGGFLDVEQGIDNILEPLREKLANGYSILIFPEGHRSADHHIQRFHRGAFYLAEKLQANIIPSLVFGTGDFLPKSAFWGRPNHLTMKILPRISWNDPAYGTNYSERTKRIRRYMSDEYALLKAEAGTASYYRRRLILNYLFKGPILEWYLKSKLRLEKNYAIYCSLLPSRGDILDLGCGYGFISYMLAYTGLDRHVTGVDYDAEKIRVASHAWDRTVCVDFHCADVAEFDIRPHDGFLLSDVLHYLPPQTQESLLRRCMEQLRPGGVILVREANSELTARHEKAKATEFMSTRIGFNKTTDSAKHLFFTDSATLRNLADQYGMQMEVIDTKRITSNNLFVISRCAVNNSTSE